ncbi:MAG: FeoB-associated Cys-rich membrane protein [Oscillospiraceae bacterium]|nr:FeoB-associated Cys-rich membrane protein [Oscillospiraceae bacterium]
MTLGDIIVIVALIAVPAACELFARRKKKHGKCSGCCGHCSGCSANPQNPHRDSLPHK